MLSNLAGDRHIYLFIYFLLREADSVVCILQSNAQKTVLGKMMEEHISKPKVLEGKNLII